jgi:hypothetical protein
MSSVRSGWSPKKEDWQRLSACINTHDIKWIQLKSFSKGSVQKVPNLPGIYMLCSLPPENKEPTLNELFTPLYIGQTKRGLKIRLNEHISKPQSSIKDVFKINGNLQVLYTTCKTASLDEIEDCLIRAFGPITNIINAKNSVKILEPLSNKASMGKKEKIKPIGD